MFGFHVSFRGAVLIYLIQSPFTSTPGNCSEEILAEAYPSHKAGAKKHAQTQALDETVASHFKPDRPLRFPLQEVRSCWRFSHHESSDIK